MNRFLIKLNQYEELLVILCYKLIVHFYHAKYQKYFETGMLLNYVIFSAE